MNIRRATLADLATLQALSIETFSQTFGHLYDPQDLARYLEDTYSLDALRELLENPDYALWIAEETVKGGNASKDPDESSMDLDEDNTGIDADSAGPGGLPSAIGYVLAGRCGLPHPEVQPQDGEIKRLYVLAGRQSAGLGRRLMSTALEWLEREGPRTLWLGVWSENYGAQRFYERFGFSKAGEYKFKVGNHRDHEFIFRRSARS